MGTKKLKLKHPLKRSIKNVKIPKNRLNKLRNSRELNKKKIFQQKKLLRSYKPFKMKKLEVMSKRLEKLKRMTSLDQNTPIN